MSSHIHIEHLIMNMIDSLIELSLDAPVMIGILTGGVWVAHKLHIGLQIDEPLGEININFYRDDFTRIGLHPLVTPSNLPFSVDDRNVILVDDVLHTGRTIRAALNEIFDFGRPRSVTLAALIDRETRELPIRADVIGQVVELAANQQIKLVGPKPLRLEVQDTNKVVNNVND